MSRRLLACSALALIALVAALTGLTHRLSLQAVLADRAALKAWVAAHPAASAMGFVGVYVAVAAAALPGAAVLSLLGGFLFGHLLGATLVILGATAGAWIVFLVARSVLGTPLRRRGGPLYDRVAGGLRANAAEVLLFLRLVPIFPFFLVNLVAALAEVRTPIFLVTTALGIAPAVFVYTGVGTRIATVSSLGDVLTPGTLAALGGLALLALAPLAVKRWRGRPVP